MLAKPYIFLFLSFPVSTKEFNLMEIKVKKPVQIKPIDIRLISQVILLFIISVFSLET